MKKIVHVIDNLGRGGAETLLTDLLPALSQHYQIVLVTLDDRNEFGDAVFAHCYKHYCLNHKKHLRLWATIKKLRNIILEHQPVLVRSQLFWSSIISKLACPRTIPLVFSVHITMEVFQETRLGPVLAMLEKATLSHRYTILGVTSKVVEEYCRKFNFKGKSFVLYNYVRSEFFIERPFQPEKTSLRLLAVGNLRPQKNYQYLIDAFKHLKGKEVYLDIYGDGPLFQSLKDEAKSEGLNISLKGKTSNIPQLMREYDAFTMVSAFEGFGIAVAEAMASGVPLLLSDIPVLREVTDNNAFFVDIYNPKSFADTCTKLLSGEKDRGKYIKQNRQTAFERYRREGYLQKLLDIYKQVIQANNEMTSKINK